LGTRSLKTTLRRAFMTPEGVQRGQNADVAAAMLREAGINPARSARIGTSRAERASDDELFARLQEKAAQEGPKAILSDIFTERADTAIIMADGLNRLEQAILRAGGVDSASIEAMNKAVIEGTKEGIKEATAELVEAMRTAQEAAAANRPAAVVDGGN